MRTRRGARSTSSPARASSWSRRPPTFSADTIGGTCSISPRNAVHAVLDLLAVERHRRRSSTSPDGVERVGGDAEHDPSPGTPSSVSWRNRISRVTPPEADEQHAGRVGIERPRVPDPPLAVDLAQLRRPRRATSTPPACRRRPTRVMAQIESTALGERALEMRADDLGDRRVVARETGGEPVAAAALLLGDAADVDVAEGTQARPATCRRAPPSTRTRPRPPVRRTTSIRPSTSSNVTPWRASRPG